MIPVDGAHAGELVGLGGVIHRGRGLENLVAWKSLQSLEPFSRELTERWRSY